MAEIKKLIKSIFIIPLMSTLFIAVGCTQKNARKDHQIRVQIPWADEQGKYSLQVIELKTVNNLSRLSGTAAQFLFIPGMTNGKLTGEAPFVHYITNSQGILIPTDRLSVELFSLYAHLEKLREKDARLAIPHSAPMTVGVQVNFQANGKAEFNNAFYSADLKAILVVPYVISDLLPLSINGGVLAHEYFHSIFDQFVLTPLGSNLKKGFDATGTRGLDDRAVYRDVLISGINEGLADFWGWAYSGDTDFILHSLNDSRVQNRSLQAKSLTLMRESELKSSTDTFVTYEYANSYYYVLGTQVAQIFKAYSDYTAKKYSLSNSDARLKVSKTIISALSLFEKKFLDTKDEGNLSPWNFIESYVLSREKTETVDCEFWQLINQNSLNLKDPTELDKLCQK